MCISAGVGTALGALSSAGQIGGTVMDMFGKGKQTATQNAYNARALEVADADRKTQAMLTALGLKRSVAGTEDNLGNKTSYDAGSNTWRSELGPDAQRAERSGQQAQTIANTVQVPMQVRANEREALRSVEAQRRADPLIAEAASFKPRTAEDEFAANTTTAARANTAATRPILQDTLRANARSGTASAPIITALADRSAEQLRNALLTGRAQAPQQAAQGNSSILDAIRARLNIIGNGTANFGNVIPNVSNANALLTQLMAARAQGSTQPAVAGAASVPQSTYASMGAFRNGAPIGSALPAQTVALGDQLSNLATAPWLLQLLRGNNPQGDVRRTTPGEE